MTKKRRPATETSAKVYMSAGRLTSDHSDDIRGGNLSFERTHCKVFQLADQTSSGVNVNARR